MHHRNKCSGAEVETVKYSIRITDLLALVATALSIYVVGSAWAALPDTVPIHFGLTGKPDGFGPKWVIWIVPASSVLLYGAMSFAVWLRSYNFPWRITEDNREESIGIAQQLMNRLKLFLSVTLLYLNWAVVQVALNRLDGIGVWFAPVFIGGIFLLIAMFYSQGSKFSRT